ncbi:Tyrosine-protein kinase [Trema orientale]|uniref:Tyrosine-protein kinase n=1 Tax=Trema orientale TaxID=63057 RepID=A0A2P5CRW0_TREOI|nr:Tyrosine-protein kinase [Trema orientale]
MGKDSVGLVKLADFGVATKLTEADVNTHSVVGTPYWMAPEVGSFRYYYGVRGAGWLCDSIEEIMVLKGNRDRQHRNGIDNNSLGAVRGGLGEFKKDWRKAVVVYRQDLDIHWSVINLGLSRELRRRVGVVELHADIVVLWCLNEVEKKLVLRYEFCRLKLEDFIPSYLEFPNGSDSVLLGIFTLGDNLVPSSSGSCRGGDKSGGPDGTTENTHVDELSEDHDEEVKDISVVGEDMELIVEDVRSLFRYGDYESSQLQQRKYQYSNALLQEGGMSLCQCKHGRIEAGFNSSN